jgi:hypothetical protein
MKAVALHPNSYIANLSSGVNQSKSWTRLLGHFAFQTTDIVLFLTHMIPYNSSFFIYHFSTASIPSSASYFSFKAQHFSAAKLS